MLQHFVERYQLWSNKKACENRGKNPLSWFAIVVVILVGFGIYEAFTSHRLTWPAVVSNAVLITFLFLYVRHSPLAWAVFPILGVICLAEALFGLLSAARYALQVRIISSSLGVIFGIVGISYGFFVRRRYELYLRDRDKDAQNI